MTHTHPEVLDHLDPLAEARAIESRIVAMRHELHRHPELGNDLPFTQRRVLAELDGLPLEITLGRSLTSVVAVLRGGAADPDLAARPVVLLRGDMDALPIPEATGQPFSSQIDGLMHGCGHDLHTATLAGAARILCRHRESLRGDVVFMFQPGEEILAGARAMLDEGLLEVAGKRPDRAFGLHVLSAVLPYGVFTTKPGTMMAASDLLTADIVGRGGHGSSPHLAIDPVPVMAEVILALQVAVTRQFSVFDPVVVNVGVANAGGAANVIPELCHIEASVRSFSRAARDKIERVLPAVVEQVCRAHGATAQVTWRRGVGPTVNDDAMADFALRQLQAVLGPERAVLLAEPFAGSEDFSFVLDEVPGAFVFYSGVPQEASLAEATFNHSATATFADYPIADATAVYVQLAVASLDELTGPP